MGESKYKKKDSSPCFQGPEGAVKETCLERTPLALSTELPVEREMLREGRSDASCEWRGGTFLVQGSRERLEGLWFRPSSCAGALPPTPTPGVLPHSLRWPLTLSFLNIPLLLAVPGPKPPVTPQCLQGKMYIPLVYR